MANATWEIVNGTLLVSGSLDRSTDAEFQQALERYAQQVPAANRVVDMSNVRWLAPTGAKVLIQAAQEAQEKSGRMRVLASRHVMQTLNLLGAKSWLQIESCLTPTPRPGDTPPAAGPAEAAKAPEPAAAKASPAAVPAATPAAEAGTGDEEETAPAAVAETQRHVAGALAGPAEDLNGGGHLLRILRVNHRYCFYFLSSDQIIGTVRERIGGPWILVDTHGTRKIINLDTVRMCEIL